MEYNEVSVEAKEFDTDEVLSEYIHLELCKLDLAPLEPKGYGDGYLIPLVIKDCIVDVFVSHSVSKTGNPEWNILIAQRVGFLRSIFRFGDFSAERKAKNIVGEIVDSIKNVKNVRWST